MARRRSLGLVAAALLCGSVTAPAVSSSAATEGGSEERFAGECQLSGLIRHQPALTQRPARTRVRGAFTGVCSGRLTDRRGRTSRLSAAFARYEARGTGRLSCLGGIATGTARIVFERGPVIDVRVVERRTPGLAVVTLRGAARGTATVRGTARSEDLAGIAERCSGSGLQLLRGDARITSPGISG